MATTPWPILTRDMVAILRGIRPDEIEAVAEALITAGIEAIEVPLNSPDPFDTIARLVAIAPDHALVGAGTVLAHEDATRLAEIGGRLMVSPNTDPAVLERAGTLGLVTMPGIFTPSEAFTALRHGASALKVFPAGALGPKGIGAMRAVLPPEVLLGAVGGVDESHFATYRAAGVRAFGLGSSLYTPGMTPADVGARARRAVTAYDAQETA